MAVRFDAATDQLALASAPASSTAVTVTAWVRNQESVGFGTFMRMRAAGTVFSFTASSGGTNGPAINTTAGSAGPYVPGAGDSLPVNGWRFVAMTINGTGSGNASVYWDDATGGSLATATGTVATGAPTALSVGGRGGGDNTERWGGDIAHMRVWSAVLSAADIQAERDSVTHVRTANVWAAWELPDSSTLTDSSGNGRHLTAGSTSATTTDGPPIQVGNGGELATTLPLPVAELVAAVSVPGGVAAALPAPTAELFAAVATSGGLAGVLPVPAAALAVDLTAAGSMAAALPVPTALLGGTVTTAGVLAAALPVPKAALFAPGEVERGHIREVLREGPGVQQLARTGATIRSGT